MAKKQQSSTSRGHRRGRARTATSARGGLEFFDGVCREILATQGRDAVASANPLEAEMWVSHVLGMFATLPLIGERGFREALGSRLLSVASGQRSVQARACLRALAAVGAGQLAAKARSAVGPGWGPSGAGPRWLDQIGTARAVTSWRASDLCGDQDSVMIGFRYANGDEHCLMVLIDHVLGGIAKDATVLPCPLAELLPTWRKDPDIDLVEEPAGVAAGRVMDALALTAVTIDAPTTDDLTDAIALIEARLSAIAEHRPEPEPLTDAEREDLVNAFLTSEGGRPLADDPAARFLLNAIVNYRCVAGLDPLRWSGGAAELFLLDWVPRELPATDVVLDRAPEVLSAWISWAGQEVGLPPHLTEEVLALVADLRSDAAEAYRDQARWGPSKRVAMTMVADGVDVSDPEAVDAWLARRSEPRDPSRMVLSAGHFTPVGAPRALARP